MEGGFTEAQLREFMDEGQVERPEDAAKWGRAVTLAASPSAFQTLITQVTWHPMTRRAISARPIASHVIDTHFEPSFRDLNGIV